MKNLTRIELSKSYQDGQAYEYTQDNGNNAHEEGIGGQIHRQYDNPKHPPWKASRDRII
jgi:hypothetical protein